MVYNLFLAARPWPDKAAEIADVGVGLNHGLRLHGNLIKPENLHVTLVEFTEVREREQAVLEKVSAAAKRIDFQSFDVSFDRALSFVKQDDKPLVLAGGDGVMGLVSLQQALIAALHKEWLKIPANSRYVPHMTLLYAAEKIPEISIPPLRWTVTEFVLIRSLAGKSTHLVLDRWPLRLGFSHERCPGARIDSAQGRA